MASSGTDVSATPTANGSVHRGGHERYERFQCVYVGSCSVGTGQGMEVLNEAVERLKLDQRQWQDVLVDVATSNVTISDKVSGHGHVWVGVATFVVGVGTATCGHMYDEV